MQTDKMVKCGYVGCSKEFEAREGKKYCCGSCRAKASVYNKTQHTLGNIPAQETTPKQFGFKPSFNMPTDPASAFIIEQLKKERDRWESEYREEKATAKKLKEEKEALEKKIMTMENDQRIAQIENAKPSGLNGLLETPGGQKLLEICAPMIQRMIEAPTAAPAQMGGTPAGPAALFETWFRKLGMSTQQTVWLMLQGLSNMPETELHNYAQQIVAQLQQTYPHAANQ